LAIISSLGLLGSIDSTLPRGQEPDFFSHATGKAAPVDLPAEMKKLFEAA